MGLLKLMNKKVIRIELLRLKRTTNGLPAIKELIHPDDRSDKLNLNKKSKVNLKIGLLYFIGNVLLS